MVKKDIPLKGQQLVSFIYYPPITSSTKKEHKNEQAHQIRAIINIGMNSSSPASAENYCLTTNKW